MNLISLPSIDLNIDRILDIAYDEMVITVTYDNSSKTELHYFDESEWLDAMAKIKEFHV